MTIVFGVMGQSKRRDLSGTHAEEDSEAALITTGKELLKLQKITKDTALKLLKVCCGLPPHLNY